MADATQEFQDKIRAALAQLDPTDNDHWTDDGLPKTGVVQRIANDSTIKRTDIQAASPGFERPAHGETENFEAPQGSNETGLAPVAAAPTDDMDPEFLSEDEVHSILAQKVAKCENDIAAADKKVAEGQNERVAAMKALNAARADLNAKFPPLTDAEMRKQYIASENLRRAERANFGQGASRVDQSMARGNSRGWRRPVRGVAGPDGNLMKTPDGQVAIPRPQQVRPTARPFAQRA